MVQAIHFNLVPFDNEAEQGVDARELHEQLGVVTRFDKWLGRRIEESMLEEGVDFCPILSKSTGGRPSTEYVLSIDAAKHVAMLERTEKGKQVRQYFIEIEKRAKQQNANPESAAIELARAVLEQSKQLDYLKQRDELFGNKTPIGQLSEITGCPKHIPVRGYLRSDRRVNKITVTEYQLDLF